MCMLKFPSIIAFSMLGNFEVSSLVISSKNAVFVRSCLGGWMIYTKDCDSFVH